MNQVALERLLLIAVSNIEHTSSAVGHCLNLYGVSDAVAC